MRRQTWSWSRASLPLSDRNDDPGSSQHEGVACSRRDGHEKGLQRPQYLGPGRSGARSILRPITASVRVIACPCLATIRSTLPCPAPGAIRSTNVPDGLVCAARAALFPVSRRLPPRGYDEAESLSYAISSICPVGADGEQGRFCETRVAPWATALRLPRQHR